MPYPLLELGGSGSLVHLAPANGFPPETYRPLLDRLAEKYRVVSLPPRALWPDAGPPPAEPGTWDVLADDLLLGMRQHGLPPGIGLGHSFGGTATLLAAVREPERFRALVLLDPTMLSPARLEQLREMRRRGEDRSRPLVQGALKRRAEFASEEEAFAYWREKPLFADWDDAAVRRYARNMLRPSPGGEGFELAWPAEWEAWYYLSISTDVWEALDRLDPSRPMLVVRGERSDTFSAEAEAVLHEKRPSAALRLLPGQGHLFPQAAPEATADLIEEWVAALPASPRSAAHR
ncbi:MAG: alpha/beta fold hydrolase [Gemmatimonadales bacterium]